MRYLYFPYIDPHGLPWVFTLRRKTDEKGDVSEADAAEHEHALRLMQASPEYSILHCLDWKRLQREETPENKIVGRWYKDLHIPTRGHSGPRHWGKVSKMIAALYPLEQKEKKE